MALTLTLILTLTLTLALTLTLTLTLTRPPRAANSAFAETCKFAGLYLGTLVAGTPLTTYYLLTTDY